MPTNNFLEIATAGGANVQTQVDYAADPDRTAFFANGDIPDADQHGKMFRQQSVIAHMIAQAVCDITGLDMLDDGGAATQLSNYKALLQQAFASGNYAVDSGAANAYVVALSPVLLAHKTGMPILVKFTNANTGASTINTGPSNKNLNNVNGTSLQKNQITAGMFGLIVYNGTVYILLTPATESKPTRYTPTFVPFYTASGMPAAFTQAVAGGTENWYLINFAIPNAIYHNTNGNVVAPSLTLTIRDGSSGGTILEQINFGMQTTAGVPIAYNANAPILMALVRLQIAPSGTYWFGVTDTESDGASHDWSSMFVTGNLAALSN